MPTAVGDRWVYRTETGGYELVAVEGTRSVQGVQAAVVATTGLGPEGAPRSEMLVARNADAVVELPDAADAVAVAIGSVHLLPLPLQVGPTATVLDRSIAAGYDYDGDGRADALAVRVDQGVLAIETVTVAAGTFSGCARVRSVAQLETTLSASGRRLAATTTIDEWYAPGIGLVRSSTVSEDGIGATTETRELTAYRVGSRRSDTQGPVPTRRTPAPDSSSPAVYQVEVEFDEPPDPASVLGTGLSVARADGQALPATVVQLGATAFRVLLHATPLPTGSYTVRLASTVADLIGNTRPAQQWTWSVDRQGPGVARSTPAHGATDVPLNTPLEVAFDEPIDISSVGPRTVQLHRDGADQWATVTVIDERTVRLTPARPLEVAGTYTLWIGSVYDAHGNGGSAPIELRFTTVPGQFGAPQAVAGAGGSALAVGDYTGDGLADLLDFSASESAVLRVHARRPAGGFDAPRPLALPDPQNCRGASALRAADMNGDGRLDVVVTRHNCGMQVLQQGADGGLALAAQLPFVDVQQIVLADLDGDGRMDIVTSPIVNQEVTVWRQSASGGFDAGTAHRAVVSSRSGLAVGDVTGDGRPDIVISSGEQNVQRLLTVLPQRADGSFGAPQTHALPGTQPGQSPLALADVTGDGRLDVVVAIFGMSSLGVLPQAADGTLGSAIMIPSVVTAAGIAVADFDGDGRRDIAVASGDGFWVRVHLQAADGSFGAGHAYAAAQQATFAPQLGAADATGDGRLDLVVAGPRVLPQLGGAAPGGATLPGSRTLRHAIGAPR